MITYGDIYDSSRKERYSEQLQQLPKNFVFEVASYLREKKEIASKEDENFSDIILKTKKQLENALTLFKELMVRRRKKILNLVLIAAETGISKQDFENMLDFEKELFEEIMRCIDLVDKKMSCSLNGKINGENKNELVIFLDAVEEFLNGEGETIGPFEKGQVVNIQKEIAKILIESGKVEVLEK
jgi:DNA replication initiation complex subunit (GINS family)